VSVTSRKLESGWQGLYYWGCHFKW